MNSLVQLIEQASLKLLFFSSGEGLGAVYLFLIAITGIVCFSKIRLNPIRWINAWRGKPESDELDS